MSGIYHTEPPTHGKVLIKTSEGDIDIELWSKEAPLACRNFVQLCLEGYYDGSPIHRVIKDFMIQMGDPTGTGKGGESIWGRPFKDEIHGRIRFNHRGQVAMANENKPHTNQSQFFITLGPCDWINQKHTIFGKVTGNTIYNVQRIGEFEVNHMDVPIDKITIVSTEVLLNPFDDIIPRESALLERQRRLQAEQAEAQKARKPERKAVRDSKLLSFADDEDGQEDVEPIIKKKPSLPPTGSTNTTANTTTKSTATVTSASQKRQAVKSRDGDDDDDDEGHKDGIAINSKPVGKSGVSASSAVTFDDDDDDDDDEEEERKYDDKYRKSASASGTPAMENRMDEFQKAREQLLKSQRAIRVLTGQEAAQYGEAQSKNEVTSLVEQRRQKFLKRKSEYGDRQEETMNKLLKFTSSLRQQKQQVAPASQDAKTDDHISTNTSAGAGVYSESYHGQVLDREQDGEVDQSWHVGKLKFRKHIDDAYRAGENAGSDGRYQDDYVVVDTRKKSSTDHQSYRRNR